MASFDPAAATAAYLATMPAAAQAKATAYTHGGHWLLLWGWLVSVAAAWLIVRSGAIPRAEAAMERRHPRLVLTSMVAGVIYTVMDFVLELPWNAYAGWWREKAYGLTSRAFAGWLTDRVIELVLTVVITMIFVAVFYALIRRTGRKWWLWAGGFAAGFLILIQVLAPVFILPLFNTYTPAPPGPVRDAVVALAEKAGVPHDKIYIYNGSKQSNRYTANVAGLGGTARVAMSDVMFKRGSDLSEVRAVVGHEMGHYKRLHVLWGTLANGVLAIVTFGLIQWTYPFAARMMGAGAVAIADPAGLPVIMALVLTLIFIGTPLTNSLTRITEADADSFSLRVANEPDGLAKAMIKTAEYRAPSPSNLEEVLFYNHPSVEHRVRKAMDWKAAHGG
jgi:STE24 endopeptidase